MKQPISSVWLTVACLCLARFESVTLAQTFAAHLESLAAGSQSKEPPGRVYVSTARRGLETTQLPDGFFLSTATSRRCGSFVQNSACSWTPGGRARSPRFCPRRSGRGCRQWRVMEAIAGPTLATPTGSAI